MSHSVPADVIATAFSSVGFSSPAYMRHVSSRMYCECITHQTKPSMKCIMNGSCNVTNMHHECVIKQIHPTHYKTNPSDTLNTFKMYHVIYIPSGVTIAEMYYQYITNMYRECIIK